jgi:hypothetical protein
MTATTHITLWISVSNDSGKVVESDHAISALRSTTQLTSDSVTAQSIFHAL